MALAERLRALAARAPKGMVLGLDRVRLALHELGDPHLAVPVAHVAGTNGKGSTSAMVESIARAAGLRTGLTTSPHLIKFAERVRLNGSPIDDAPFERALARVLDRATPELTFFESLTLAAFVAFAEAKVDLAILEVGLGGRLDATNVIPAPLVTAITSIDLDHTAILGGTLELIAREKAGIAKLGVPLVLGPIAEEARRAIEEVALSVSAGPRSSPGEDAEVRALAASVALEGPHQLENACVAVGAARALARSFPQIDDDAIRRGLASVTWPGRFERFDVRGRIAYLDCAHNPHGARALRSTVEAARKKGAAFEPASTTLVFGALGDKAWREVLAELAPLADHRIYCEPQGARAPVAAEELARVAAGEIEREPIRAVERALDEAPRGGATRVLIAGSSYLAGAVRAHWLGVEADPAIGL